jgi:hypothetical protein
MAARPCSVTPMKAWGLEADFMASTATLTLPSVPVWNNVSEMNEAYTRGFVLTILESDGEGDTGGELTVELRLSGTSTDGTPRDKVRNVLGRDGVEEFGSDRDTEAGKIAQELTSKAQTLVDLEGPVEVWVIDETLPSDCRTWFLLKG